MTRYKYLVGLFLLLYSSFIYNDATAQYIYTANSRLIHVQEANVPSDIRLSAYTHVEGYAVLSALTSDERFSIITNSLNVDYTLTDNLLMSLSPTLYQDLNGIKGESSNFPLHNLNLSLKYGSLNLTAPNFKIGFLVSALFPLTDKNNIYGQLYTGGGNEIGGNVLLSYYSDKYFPEEAFSIHANIGYYNFFDEGEDISNSNREAIVEENSSAFNYSIGLKVPTQLIDTDAELFLEYWGQKFLTQPPIYAYSREDISFVTLGVKISPKSFLSFELSGDLLVTGDDEETTYSREYRIRFFPSASYPNYKLSFGVKLNLMSKKKVVTFAKPVSLPVRSSASVNFETLYKDDSKNEKVEQINAIRMNIEKNLRQIREALKGDYDSGNEEE